MKKGAKIKNIDKTNNKRAILKTHEIQQQRHWEMQALTDAKIYGKATQVNVSDTSIYHLLVHFGLKKLWVVPKDRIRFYITASALTNHHCIFSNLKFNKLIMGIAECD